MYPQLWFFSILRFYKYFFVRKLNNKIQERLKIERLPHLGDIEKKTALILIGSDYSLTPPIPKSPNEVFVGGLQIVEPKPLSEVDYIFF